MKVSKLAQSPAPSVEAGSSVYQAVKAMEEAKCGAVAVMDKGQLVGVLSERDVMLRVVGRRRSAERTKVREVMTRGVKTVSPETDTADALAVMVSNHIRHVVVVNRRGGVVGLVHMREAYPAQMERVEDQLRTLEAYVETDCPGG